MPVNKLFGGNIELAGKALNLRMQRQGLIQSNIANLETPGYKVQELPFARVLESVAAGQGELARTHPGHIAPEPAAAQARQSSAERPVDLDEEMVKLSENQLMYQITTRILAKKFEGLSRAIDGGGQ